MSETTENPTPVNPVQAMTAEVAEILKSSAPTVRKRLIDIRVEKELTKRTQMLADGIERRSTLDKELRKVKGTEVFDANGNKTGETFTKEQAGKMKEMKDKLKALDEALVLAMDQANYDKLTKCLESKAPAITPDPVE